MDRLHPSLTPTLSSDWAFLARPEQLPPPNSIWSIWLYLAGRGSGKTRTGAEWVLDNLITGRMRRFAIIGQTEKEVHRTMLHGDSGLLTICPRDFQPKWDGKEKCYLFPNGARASLYSGDRPDQLRGPQHDGGWLDELAKWRYPQSTWDMFEFGWRLGDHPRCFISTTPKPIKILFNLVKDPECVVTTGSTYSNLANLPIRFIQRIRRKYEGTQLGRQELLGHLLEDMPGALWRRAWFDRDRLTITPHPLIEVVVALDPAVTANKNSNETGIIVVGKDEAGHCYVLDDRSGRYPPQVWARIALELYVNYDCSYIVGEVNNGGDLVNQNIQTCAWSLGITTGIPFHSVHASRGKITRAEPIALLYEQKRVHHVSIDPHRFDYIEDEMVTFIQSANDRDSGTLEDEEPMEGEISSSPDRVDALVWGIWHLLLEGEEREEMVAAQADIYRSKY